MDIASIVYLLIFVLPGILAEKISYRMDFPSGENRSEFREIISGLLLSFPIIFIAGLITTQYKAFTSLKVLIAYFDNLQFLLKFSMLVFFIAVIFGVIKGLTNDFWESVINYIRKRFNKMDVSDKTCWRNVFLDDNVSRYIKIIKDGSVIREGFALHYSLPNEEKAIALENPDNLEQYPEFKDYLKLCKTYINIENGVIIEVYDTKRFEEYLKK